MKGLNVPREKAPVPLNHIHCFLSDNDGFYYANCETEIDNRECYYISSGCTGCLIQPTHEEILQRTKKELNVQIDTKILDMKKGITWYINNLYDSLESVDMPPETE